MISQVNIDADILLYKAGMPNQSEVDWGDTGSSTIIDLDTAKQAFVDMVAYIMGQTTGNNLNESYGLAISQGKNFRYDLRSDYKHNRPETPEIIRQLKAWVLSRFSHKIMPNPSKTLILEADDILGLAQRDDTVLVSTDKDLRQIPGLHWNFSKPVIHYIKPVDALKWHYIQALMGDPTDGYCGCPNVGKSTARRLIDATPDNLWWHTVLHTYNMAGLDETEALTQARLAKIYDNSMNPDTLWEPKVEPIDPVTKVILQKMMGEASIER